ncbi:hypothetical protein Poli38472_013678 [Pythium oligandrum]|uniref:Ankyrin repeat protein n=1 Tax=Pythium oligandrum TaxID=41045 RepID=A0A8K1FF35_PYTOL|nr:hypothetical protein Poli38472_013678 [Pythium oligandrum]|eukprot:TMW61215.1 hypothetical protein Poli38472_013678 [Pythium oligandrum]
MKRKSRDAGALNGRRKGMMATQHVQEASAVVSVLGDASLLRLVTSYQRGIPVVFPALAKKHGITPENIEKARREARTHGKLLEPGQTFIFNVDPTRSQYLEQLKRMQASYMEMAIKDDDFRVLKMVYKLHKRGISNEHPRFGFRRPMRVAATDILLANSQILKDTSMSKRERVVAKARDEGLHTKKKVSQTEQTKAEVDVLLNPALLRYVGSFQSGIPVLFPELAKKHGITPANVTKARQEAMRHGGLAQYATPYDICKLPCQEKALEELRRMQVSYMEMAIKDNDLRVLKLVYALHKQGISSEHPRFGFRRPMRVAATYGRLEMLQWLKELEEGAEWLKDKWLLDAALKSYKLEIVQWVYGVYDGKKPSVVRWKALNEIASKGALELLQWALATFEDTQLTTDAMDGAAANGHLMTLEYLHWERSEGCTTLAMDKAAGNGHLAVVEFLHTQRMEGCTVSAMNDAAVNGHLHVVKYLHEHCSEGCTTKAMNGAAANGHFDVVRFLHTSRMEGCTADAMYGAIRNGHMDIVEFLHEQQCFFGDVRIALYNAMRKNHLDVIRFVCQHYGQDICADSLRYATSENMIELICVFEVFEIEGWTYHAMDRAAEMGCLEAVQYLHSNRTEGCTTRAMDTAACGGHLDVVRFLHENRSEGCTKRAMDGAAEKGLLDVLEYLHENRSEGCTSRAVRNAVMNGHIEVVKFLLDCCDVSCPSDVIECAARLVNWDMLELLLELDLPDDLSSVMRHVAASGHLGILKRLSHLTGIFPSSCICKAAAEYGHWYVVKYLLRSCRPNDRDADLYSTLLDAASLYGDLDMASLIVTVEDCYFPSSAHGFVNTIALGNIDLLELLWDARQGEDDWDEDFEDFEYIGLDRCAVLFATAATHGHVEIVELLRRRYPSVKNDPAVLPFCAESGDIDMVRMLLPDEDSDEAIQEAVQRVTAAGHLGALKYLVEHLLLKHGPRGMQKLPDDLLFDAACSHFYDMLTYVYEHSQPDVNILSAINVAAEHGNLDMVRYLLAQKPNVSLVKALNKAARCDALDCLRFLHAQSQQRFTKKTTHDVAKDGLLDIVKFLHEECEVDWSPSVMDVAASEDHLHIVKFLHTRRTEGCTSSAMDFAAGSGSLRVVKFLHENRHEGCSVKAMDYAARNGFLSIVKYLHENRSEGCTKAALDSAIRNQDLTMVKFLHEHRCEGFHQAVLEKALTKDPDDVGLVQHYLLPETLRDKKARETFVKRLKFDRLFKRGRFAPDVRAQEADDYDSGNESDAWVRRCRCRLGLSSNRMLHHH